MNPNVCFLKIRGLKHAVSIRSPKDIAPLILQAMSNLPFWSYDSLKTLYIGLLGMIITFCEEQKELKTGSERANYTRTIGRTMRSLRYVPTDRDIMLRVLYDLILKSEDMDRLRGFGICTKFGDKVKGNPEFSRMTKIK